MVTGEKIQIILRPAALGIIIAGGLLTGAYEVNKKFHQHAGQQEEIVEEFGPLTTLGEMPSEIHNQLDANSISRRIPLHVLEPFIGPVDSQVASGIELKSELIPGN